MAYEEKIFIDLITRVKGEKISNLIKIPKELSKGMQKSTIVARKFRMELLSIMFGAMSLSRTFDNLLKPMEDATGLQEYWNAIMLENTADAIDPSIEALETAGEAFRYVNNVTGGTMGKMFMFGRAVGDTMSTVGQANLFFDGLVTNLTKIGAGGGIAAGAIATTVEMLAGIALPIVFFNEDNLKVANAFLSDTNKEIEKVVDGEYRQIAAIRSLNYVLPTLKDIFFTNKDIKEKIDEAKTSVQLFGVSIKDLPTTDDLGFIPLKASVDDVIKAVDSISTTALDDLEESGINTKNAMDSIETTALDNLEESIKKAKEEMDELNKSALLPISKEVKINIVYELLGTVGNFLSKFLQEKSFFELKQLWDIGTFFKKILGLQGGGIVTRPTTALLGERGPEAVIPLDRIGSIGGINVTINTATIGGNVDMLAREIAEKFAFELSRVRY